MTKKNLSSHVGNAFQTLLSHGIIFIPLLILLGIFDTFLFHTALKINGLKPTDNILQMGLSQSALIKLSFSHLGMMLIYKALIGPIVSMLVVVYSRARIMQQPLNIGEAINFVMKRYGSVFLPYLLAMLSIQIGSIIVIPGIMFMMQYAFVDSVATLEKEKHVLTRSKRLTKSRRRSLIFLILPYILIGQGIQIGEFVYSADISKLILINMAYEGILVLVLSSFYSLYHERIALIAERKKRKAEKEQKNNEE